MERIPPGALRPAWSGSSAPNCSSSLSTIREFWYRYHHLFQQLLQQHLYAEAPADQVSQLHRQASVWFETHQLLDEALQHAVCSRRHGSGLPPDRRRDVRSAQPGGPGHARPLAPHDARRDRPATGSTADGPSLGAAVSRGASACKSRSSSAPRNCSILRKLRRSQRATGRSCAAQISLIRAEQAFFSNQHQRAMDLSRQVLGLLPPAWSFVRGGAMMYLAVSMQASGRAQEAEEMFLKEYEARFDRSDTFALFILQSLCFVYLNAGRLDRAQQSAQLLADNSSQAGMALMGSWGDWHLGMVGYLRNELEAAAKYFTAIVDNRYVAHTSTYRDAIAGLALIHQSKGESANAWQLVASISQYDLEQGGSEDPRTRIPARPADAPRRGPGRRRRLG